MARQSSKRQAPPRFTTLSPTECSKILRRNSVGRLAYARQTRVDIEPIHYVYDGEWLYGRTSLGSKVKALVRRPWAALEVDEIEGTFDWRSVVVRGGFYPLNPNGPEHQVRAWERGVELLRTLIPETLTERDPAPFRTIVFRIHVDEMTGRAASTRRVSSGT
jgi:uncharacterized protein